jgi:hypothetical protein
MVEDFMNVNITRGQLLQMDFDLPFTEPPAETMHLDMNGEELMFTQGNVTVASFTQNDDPELTLMYIGKWIIRFQTEEYDYLPRGTTNFEFTAVRNDGFLLKECFGTVTVYEL